MEAPYSISIHIAYRRAKKRREEKRREETPQEGTCVIIIKLGGDIPVILAIYYRATENISGRSPLLLFSLLSFCWRLAMANSRQRIAKRRFSGVPTTSSSSSTVDVRPVSLRVKKKSILKSKKGHSSSSSSSSSSKSKVHPLRVPGSKPGDGCFICKSSSHVAKTCPQKVSKDKNKVCFLSICFFLFFLEGRYGYKSDVFPHSFAFHQR